MLSMFIYRNLIFTSILGFSFSEKLVWSDEFDVLDEDKWSHLVTTYPLVNIF